MIVVLFRISVLDYMREDLDQTFGEIFVFMRIGTHHTMQDINPCKDDRCLLIVQGFYCQLPKIIDILRVFLKDIKHNQKCFPTKNRGLMFD